MRNPLKKIVSFLLAFCVTVSMVPSAFAAEENVFTVDGIHYRVTSENEVEVCNPNWVESAAPDQEYSDYTGDVTIPETVKNGEQEYRVTAIAAVAFANAKVSSVTLPDSIESIGENAFRSCEATEITLGNGLKSIGHYAFNLCKFESLTIPDGVKTIGNAAFNQCTSLISLTIPDSVTSIGKAAFTMCSSLETLTLNEGLTSIGEAAFQLCNSLTELTIPASVTSGIGEALEAYPYVSSVSFAEGSPFEIQDGILYLGNEMETILSENLGDVRIRDGVTEIPDSFFADQSTLTSIVIPEGITQIPDYAFAGCVSLKKVQLPEGITSIGKYAFDLTENDGDDNYVNKNPQLEEINIPSTVTSLGEKFLGGLKADSGTKVISNVSDPSIFSEEAMAGVESATFIVPAEVADQYQESLGEEITVQNPNVLVTEITVNPASVNLTTGETASLTANVGPNNATNMIVTWSSSDETVATVDANGVVTAVGAGTATITATANDGSNVTGTCTVTVTPPVAPSVPVESVTVNPAAINLTEGGTRTLTANVSPDNATNKAVTWTSSNTAVATVDANGVVTAVGAGTATITATADNGQTATCTVTVTANTPTYPTYPSYPDYSGGNNRPGSTSRPSTSTPSTTIPDDPTPLDPGTDIADQDVPLAGIPLPFVDVTAGQWHRDAVAYVFSKGLMTGATGTTFEPETQISRGMIVTMLYRLEGNPAAGMSAFQDVVDAEYWAEAIGWAAQNGVVLGYSATEFAPADEITREQMAAILFRYMRLKGYDTGKRADLSAYTDADQISEYAVEAMRWAVAEGLITGVTESTLVPGGSATRAQAAMILMRFCENVAK